MVFEAPSVLLITGIMASGKSTIAQRVAQRLPKSVHLRGDMFRRMIVNNRVEIEPDTTDAALAQLRLRYKLATTAADLYCQEGFTVVYQDIVIGPMLNAVVEQLKHRPLYIVVLCPSPDVAGKRDAEREKTGYGTWTPEALDTELRQNTPRVGLWLDNSALTVEETVDAIFAQAEQTTTGLR